jgi:hypothetical protein
MAIFNVSRPFKIVVKGASVSVIPNPQGIPVAVNTPAKTIELKPGNNTITDVEVIERIRQDQKFGIQDGIKEITDDDLEAISIRDKKSKEAEEEIKESKKRRASK